MQQIGLFFGSFNPIHTGHLVIASAMVEHTELDRVWFVVSPQNPFKPSRTLLHEFDRYDMVEAAIADDARFGITDVEFHLPRPSYTINTLDQLKVRHPDKSFSLILGEDNLEEFQRWKDWEKIISGHRLFVYPRPGCQPCELRSHPQVRMVPAPMMEISATYIRQAVKDRKSIRYLVPDPVVDIIDKKGFYLS